jgi:hypothetical protein
VYSETETKEESVPQQFYDTDLATGSFDFGHVTPLALPIKLTGAWVSRPKGGRQTRVRFDAMLGLISIEP